MPLPSRIWKWVQAGKSCPGGWLRLWPGESVRGRGSLGDSDSVAMDSYKDQKAECGNQSNQVGVSL